ncbi:DUF2057 domain-containing protein [Corallincola luteus]|uniref:DUF2057 domain-containing protein n=1 Tax=Corallincola luteus TaxID=1775177 RepID=A0ABY2AHR3_9GAMM|nr:DUF2057 family protein [Corallincola luteus]TCI01556.1 DUF2057 domain-containing protein [Corallincola luteus]
MRHLIIILLSVAAITLPQQATANTTLAIPEEIEVISVDGKDLGFRLLNQPDKLNFAKGEHVLELRYKDLFEDDEGAHAVIKSVPLYVRFAAIENGEFKMLLETPEDEESAEIFAAAPSVQIVNTQDNSVVMTRQVTETKQQQNWLASLLALPDADEVHTAPAVPTSDDLATPQTASSVATGAKPVTPKTLEMLRYWWQEADVATRQQFMKEVLSQ